MPVHRGWWEGARVQTELCVWKVVGAGRAWAEDMIELDEEAFTVQSLFSANYNISKSEEIH